MFCCVSFSQIVFHGTTVVVVRNKDSIIIGADSKLLTNNPIISLAKIETTTEKIRICGSIAFALAGNYSAIDFKNPIPCIFIYDTIYEAYPIAESIFRADGDIFQKSTKFCVKMRKPIETAWTSIVKHDGSASLQHSSLVLVAGTIYRDIPCVVVEYLYPQRIAYQYVPILYPIERIFPEEGRVDSIDNLVFSNVLKNKSVPVLNSLISTNPVQYIRKMIELAIKTDSLENGYPIKILCITRKDMDWIQ